MACGPSYITAAFRSTKQDEAYIFLKNKYVVDDYCPGKATDKILCGPTPNSDGFSSLKGTIFGEYGIDCAFASHDTGKAYIFALHDCALIEYSPCSKSDMIVKGPIPIAEMFPFLKGTVFEKGLDAAFESSIQYEAYLFKGDKYARINYGPTNARLMNQGPIAQFWPCLKGTIFETDIGAAFASHRYNEAYLFKGDYYGHLKFTPGQTNDVLNGGVRKIKDYWPNLAKLLPNANLNAN